MRKRSLTIAGHRTSLALEAQFWEALETIAAERGMSLAQLVTSVDQTRVEANLSSALRIFALDHFRARGSER